jgi:hypothetical protein
MDRNEKKEHDEKVAKVKSDISVNLIQRNKAPEKLVKSLEDALATCKVLSPKFGNQRELLARSRMTERVIVSSLKMIANNRLALWMITDREIEEGIE